ncbi:MAG TPA: prepilin-type N-terminal cleavage/methylation domain-containing protein [Candidatus Saccharimonadales bacterium]|jgi:type II secretory pathway pseudopilin PulG
MRDNRGFTLVEMLIVVPIFVLIVMIMFGILIDRYGEVVRENARVNLLIEAQSLLLTIEDEVLFADEFKSSKDSNLTDNYAPSGGWDNDTDPDTLIIRETALTHDRRDPDRDFVRYPHPSNGCSQDYSIAYDNLIYFTVDNSDDDYRTLYKRTLVPDTGSVCQTNYKGHSCPEANLGTGVCARRDALFSQNVVDFEVLYFDENGNSIDDENGGSPSQAERVTVTLTLGDIAYGDTIQESASITMKKIN